MPVQSSADDKVLWERGFSFGDSIEKDVRICNKIQAAMYKSVYMCQTWYDSYNL